VQLDAKSPNSTTTSFKITYAKVDGHIWTVLAELDSNRGMSITNNSEAVVARAKAHILGTFPDKTTFVTDDRFFEVYEHRLVDRANDGIDPEVVEVAFMGGAWIRVHPSEIAHMATPLCILMRCLHGQYPNSPQMHEDIALAAAPAPAG
jgi:hypothetical protein